MAESVQSYSSHRRFMPLWHYFALPVLAANVGLSVWRLIAHPRPMNVWGLLVAMAIFATLLSARGMAITTQNRIIRAEESSRIPRLLPPDLQDKAADLTASQLIALRFAPDEEIPELTRRCIAGELKTSDDIKKAIRNWRADHIRV